MNITLAKRACRLYRSEYVSKAVNRFNQRAWLKAVQSLGPKWLLAVPHVKTELKEGKPS